MQADLNNKVAVVTGGNGVLGSAMTKALAKCGAKLAVLDLTIETDNALVEEINQAGGEAIGVSCDVLDKASIENANQIIEKKLGPVDILINGAGGNHPQATTDNEALEPEDLQKIGGEMKTFYDLTQEGIEAVFNLNFMGTLLPCQVFTRQMAERKEGVVINISSMNAFKPLTKIPAYSGAKAAVSNFTQWLAVHMAQSGIRVNAIAPGFFLTKQNQALLTREDGSLTARGQKIIDHTPMGEFGSPEDLTGPLLWLVANEQSRFVTGIVLPVDGGFSAFSGI